MTLSHQKVFDSPPAGSQALARPGTSQLDPIWDSFRTFPPKFGEERANERAAQELRTAGGGEGREEKRETDRGGGAWADARLSFGDV